MNEQQAEVIAIQALGWLAANDELFPVFLGATGADAATVRNRAQDPDFLGSVLDFLTMDDAWVMAFCHNAGLAYDRPLAARRALPGGGEVHWT